MTATANSALSRAMNWLVEATEKQAYGVVQVSITMQDGNIVLIRKTIEDTSKP